MPILAPTLLEISQRMKRFLASKDLRTKEIRETFIEPAKKIGQVIVIGGAVRDLALYGVKERPLSDIDFVVTGSAGQLNTFALRLGAAPNRFGGYSLKNGGLCVDFWSLHNTWAKRNANITIASPKDLVKATFFDWDGVVYNHSKDELYTLPNYIDRLNRRVLDLNLEANPSVKGNLVRALRRLIMWDARPGVRLNRFLRNNLFQFSWLEITEAERNAFHITYLDQFSSSMDFLRRALADRSFKRIGVDDRRQRSFNFEAKVRGD